MKNLKVALAQISCRLGDIEANIQKHLEYIEKAKAAKAELVMFPELSLTGYSLKDAVYDVALTVDDPILKPLYEASKDIAIAFGMVELTSRLEANNTHVFLEGGKLAARHRKVYLPTYGVFEEKRYFTPGNRFRAFDSKLGRFGMMICEDMWHPSSTMILALDGARALFVGAAGLFRGVRADARAENVEAWENLNRTSAQNYTSYFIFCNRVGVEDGLVFWGGSEIIDPHGKQVAKAPYFDEALLVHEIDWAVLKHARVHTTLLSDERIDLVVEELQRIARDSKEY
jgi:NAD+ synthase (glutamine-hydrolysing)